MTPQRLGFLLLPPFGLLSLTGPLAVLLACNELLDAPLFEPTLLSVDADPLPDELGRILRTPLGIAAALDALFVVSDRWPQDHDPSLFAVETLLRPVAARGGVLGGIGTGAAWLARGGFLRDYRCTLHWAHVAQLAECHPDSIVSSNLYEIDRQRVTCPGGSASLDMAIAWLSRLHGERTGQRLIAHFGLERLRAGNERQQVPNTVRLGGSAKLVEAVALMEANIGEPLNTDDIARLVGVSRRQLERLFKQQLDALPSRWYLNLRLAHARRLLQQTSQSILQVGLSSGFASAPHFSNAYRSHFGRTPREERGARAAAWRAGTSDPSSKEH